MLHVICPTPPHRIVSCGGEGSGRTAAQEGHSFGWFLICWCGSRGLQGAGGHALGALLPLRHSFRGLTHLYHLQAGCFFYFFFSSTEANATTNNIISTGVSSETESENCFITHIFRIQDLKKKFLLMMLLFTILVM